MKKFNWFPLIYLGILILSLAHFYSGGSIILGGESNVCLDYSNLIHHHLTDYTHNAIGFNLYVLAFLQSFLPFWLVNLIPILCTFYLPFLCFYFLAKKLGASKEVSTLVSLFYSLNPFMYIFLGQLTGNQAVMILMPSLFLIILNIKSNLKFFLVFGLVSTLFSFVYANPPMCGSVLLAILFMVIFAYGFSFKKLALVYGSFITFNSWWIIPLILNIKKAQAIYTPQTAHIRLAESMTGITHWSNDVLSSILLLKVGIEKDPSYSYLTSWFTMPFSSLFLVLPALMVVWGIIYEIRVIRIKKSGIWWSFLTLFLLAFLMKGTYPPFGGIYQWAFNHILFFNIFKSSMEKFGVIYVFVFSILLVKVFKQKFHFPMWIYVIFCSVPLLTGHLMPDTKITEGHFATRKYYDKQEYKDLRVYLNKAKDCKIISFPGNNNYQVCFIQPNGKFYTGLDPILSNTNKEFINSWVTTRPYTELNMRYYKNIENYKVLINEDYIPWFGTFEKETPKQLKDFFSKFMKARKFGNLTLYE